MGSAVVIRDVRYLYHNPCPERCYRPIRTTSGFQNCLNGNQALEANSSILTRALWCKRIPRNTVLQLTSKWRRFSWQLGAIVVEFLAVLQPNGQKIIHLDLELMHSTTEGSSMGLCVLRVHIRYHQTEFRYGAALTVTIKKSQSSLSVAVAKMLRTVWRVWFKITRRLPILISSWRKTSVMNRWAQVFATFGKKYVKTSERSSSDQVSQITCGTLFGRIVSCWRRLIFDSNLLHPNPYRRLPGNMMLIVSGNLSISMSNYERIKELKAGVLYLCLVRSWRSPFTRFFC